MDLRGPTDAFPETGGQGKFDLELLKFLNLHFALNSGPKSSINGKTDSHQQNAEISTCLPLNEATESSIKGMKVLKPSKVDASAEVLSAVVLLDEFTRNPVIFPESLEYFLSL